MTTEFQRSRLWGSAAFNEQVLSIAGQKLEPDMTKGYLEFKMAHAFHVTPEGKPGGITGYGTATSAATLSRSYQTLLHQLVDLGHKVKSYDRSKDRDKIPRDYPMGSIVAVEYPQTPVTGWDMTMMSDRVPYIHGAAVIHKQLEKVPQVLGEHLGGRHKWSVSLEMKFHHSKSGFIVHNRSKAKKSQSIVLNEFTPIAFNDLDMGYIAVEAAPKDLKDSYNGPENRIIGPWGDLPVTYLQGGLDGENHFMGMGIVRYGAELEAEISQILASDPDKLDFYFEEDVAALKEYFSGVVKSYETAPKLF